MELRDKNEAKGAAENGIRAAEKAVAIKPDSGEFHRVLGALCGQVIPANPLAGLRYGRCALDEVNKAVELAPKSSLVYLSRGVGNYYLPPPSAAAPTSPSKISTNPSNSTPKTLTPGSGKASCSAK